MDELARYNKERWEELAKAGVWCSRPMLDLDADSARRLVDPEGVMDDPARGRDVLCLAGGGGQQSAAFALLGARVTVLDFCQTQLERDRVAAAHYGTQVRTVLGDMRDLSCFAPGSFDLVWHGHSLNFVPEAGVVFDQVRRVLRPGGQYRLHCWNPYAHGLDSKHWAGTGYLMTYPYVEGAEIDTYSFWKVAPWDPPAPGSPPPAASQDIPRIQIRGPREFRHTLTTIVCGLISRGFVLQGLWEEEPGDLQAAPGTWDHFKAYAPPWLAIWARFGPEEP
jgi:SAM-dependent methyltransferase